MAELSDDDIRALVALSRMVRGVRGNGVTVTPNGITIFGPQSRRPPVLPDGFQWVKVTGAGNTLGNGNYDGRLQRSQADSGQITAADDFTPGNLLENISTSDDCLIVVSGDNGHTQYKVGDYVYAKRQGWSTDDSPPRPVYAPAGGGGGDLFPVTLSSPTGSAGANTPTPAAATYTYTVTDLSGTQLGTGVSVWMSRQKGHVTAATKGLAAYISGTLYIMICDEVIDATTC